MSLTIPQADIFTNVWHDFDNDLVTNEIVIKIAVNQSSINQLNNRVKTETLDLKQFYNLTDFKII